MRTRFLVGSVLALAPLVALSAQQQPTFKTAVDLVTVDVHVVDRAGNPVAGLRPDDFTITVDGRPRRAATAQFVDYAGTAGNVPAPPAGAAAPAPAAPAPSDASPAATALQPAARTVYLLVDEANIRPGGAHFAAEAAGAFMDRLRPQDRVGLMTIPFTSNRVEATTDRGAVRTALQRVAGHMSGEAQLSQERAVGLSEAFAFGNDKRTWGRVVTRECIEKRAGSPPDESEMRECVSDLERIARAMVVDSRERMLTSARSLSAFAQALTRLPGPKTVVLLTEELPVAPSLAERKDFESETANIAAAAAKAQVSVYVLHLDRPLFDVENRVHPPSAGADADIRASGLETVTALTGGRRLMVSGRAEPAFERIAREMSAVYLVGFEAEPGDRDGKPHTVTVSTSRKGVEVRARRMFAFDARTAAPAAAPAASIQQPATLVQQAAPSQPAAPVSPAAPPSAPVVTPPATPVPDRAPAAASPGTGAAAGTSPAAADQLVARAGQALALYAEQLSLVIGTENYAQYMGDESFARAYKRLLVSEFALVRVKDDWLGFRDVYELDGSPVRDRQDRLRSLFLDNQEAAVSQARRISDEGARHNLGAMQRNFNVPTMALFFLQPSNAARFRFRKDGEGKIGGTPVWRVRYEETKKPTIIRTSAGKDMPLSGSFWIDPLTGRVWKTHMELMADVTMGGSGTSIVQRVRSSASITVTYKMHESLGLLVPAEMLETYEGPSVNRFTGKEEISRVNCRATYSDFKRFETSGKVVVQ